MPSYRVQHTTLYKYADPVPVCHNLAHLLPRDSADHRWTSAEIDIHPVPAIRATRLDYFGNRLTFFAIQEPHRKLQVTATSNVEVTRHERPAPLPSADGSWENAQAIFHSSAHQSPELLDAFQFIFESPFVKWTADVHAYARESFTPERSLIEAVLDLTHRIHRDFAYNPKTTTVTTTLPEILKSRAGVCQDFAHLEIGCLRSMGLAARYVSGYLLTTPPPGKPRLVGADASHAWLSVFVPGLGWLDLDPTNNVIPADKHITIAWGRDFGDVSPLRGVILGGGKHTVDVRVDVAPIPMPPLA